MKISGVDIRPGNIIEYEKGLWRAVKIQHTQPGKGGAYMQVELKNLIDGRKTNVRFRSSETVERVRLDTKDFQYLYAEGDQLTFMDKATYDQVQLPRDLLGDAAAFLQDGMDVVMELYEDKPISVQLPDQIEATIVEADAVVKGQTASSSYKPAILDNGVRVMVPPHITAGTRIVVPIGPLHLQGQGHLRPGAASPRPPRGRCRLPAGRHGRGDGALRGQADLGAVARPDRGDDRGGRRSGQGPDGILVLQARDPRQWRARDGAAAHYGGHAHRR